ncbi:helix-turn-helix domain-containing protein [Actinomadura violacea]|uniref:Helix-turn-helix domain-containing protein n=1 Tax=Actinomadura violacea TaxID=2819934 RepID=A0ABS3RM70_9ACTN|nr:helix-turn-helix domain-containing protein [Actinomadura violacea]MBO2457835.1 helix-turn-helix domain-containing protein [Actinomadura violacea]
MRAPGHATEPDCGPETGRPGPDAPDVPDDEVRAALAAALRAAVPAIVAETVEEVRRDVVEYAAPACRDALELAAGCTLGAFADLVARPGPPPDDLLALFRRIGAAEVQEGRAASALQNAANVATRVVVRHLSRVADALDAEVPSGLYGQVVSALFPLLNALTVAVAQGRAEAARDPAVLLLRRRRALLDALLARPATEPRRIAGLAREAGWPLPRRAAAVALAPGAEPPRPRALPPQVLDGRHLAEPCLIVPDPRDPAHRLTLEPLLGGLAAAVGPAVEPAALARSLAWARQALALALDGTLGAALDGEPPGDPPGRGPVIAADHAPTLVVLRHRDLVEHSARRRLNPLLNIRQNRRTQYARTLQAVLECGFNASAAAVRLRVHPQTVRLRMRKLDELFGAEIHDPSLHVELLMALRLWLATTRPDGQPDWFLNGLASAPA